MYDLINDKNEISINFFDWGHLLELALHYGWTPMGTRLSHPKMIEPWSGRYTSCDGQYVLKEDAINIGKALEKALNNIPDSYIGETFYEEFNIEANTLGDIAIATFGFEQQNRDLPLETLLRKFSGKASKKHIQKLIDFCYEGKGFEIY